jgi:hypothetical protein
MRLNIKPETPELAIPTNLAAAIDETVEAAFSLRIPESELIDIVKDRIHKRADLIDSRQFFSPNKMFYPEAGP